MRTFRDIFNDLEEISKKEQFLEVVTYLSHKNLNCSVGELGKRDFNILLNENEIIFLFGLWLKNFKNGKNVKITDIEKECVVVHKLMNELHSTFIPEFKLDESVRFEDFHITQRNNPNILKEIIFYAGTGAYDFQYMDFLDKKYQLDKNWISEKYGFELNDVVDLFTIIKIGFNNRLNKNTYDSSNILELYRINISEPILKDNKKYIKILDLFSCNLNDDINLNNSFSDICDSNYFKIKPVIKTKNDYILPLPSLLATAFYENFFYWMLEDESYEKKALNNRGLIAEKIVYDLISEKYSNVNIYKNIHVKETKEKTITDLDILLQKDDRLIIFQVKSKKLTELSKQGNITKYEKDFNQAISQAYEQAIRPYYHLYNQKCKLINNGTDLSIERPNKIHSICVVLDSFPSLNTHIRLFYNIKKDTPIALSIFDLEIMLTFFDDINQLFDYLEIRNQMMGKLVSEEEISLLQAFLSNNIQQNNEYDFIYFDNSFAQKFDQTFYLPLLEKYYSKYQQIILKNYT
ncbi:hypothetical protein PG593_00840 [Riemerella anatipestifer]|nr:hypothetical protein [Riemerella anatipestifer]